MQLSYFTNGAAGFEKLHGPRVIHIFLFKYMPYLISYSNSRLSFNMAPEMPFFSLFAFSSNFPESYKIQNTKNSFLVFTFKFCKWINMFGWVPFVGFSQACPSFLLPVLIFSFFFPEVPLHIPGGKKRKYRKIAQYVFKCQFRCLQTITIKST